MEISFIEVIKISIKKLFSIVHYTLSNRLQLHLQQIIFLGIFTKRISMIAMMEEETSVFPIL